jgi:hypothetical protein
MSCADAILRLKISVDGHDRHLGLFLSFNIDAMAGALEGEIAMPATPLAIRSDDELDLTGLVGGQCRAGYRGIHIRNPGAPRSIFCSRCRAR